LDSQTLQTFAPIDNPLFQLETLIFTLNNHINRKTAPFGAVEKIFKNFMKTP
jgi:hypothetical protein